MAGAKKVGERFPALNGWGGVRSVQRRLDRSPTIVQNREAVAYQLLCMANTKITDVLEWDEDGNVRVKAASRMPEHALNAIKDIQVTSYKENVFLQEQLLFLKMTVLAVKIK